ncbi:MAG: hypothetical protein ACRC9R_02685 [Enterovibrio sp.]
MDYSKAAVYVLIPKKYLTRYVLVYDVLPLELCYTIGGKYFFGVELLSSLMSQGMVSDNDVILEFTKESFDPYIPLSELLSLGFISQASLDLFKDASYANYNVDTISCEIIKTPKNNVECDIEVLPPLQFDKPTISQKMAFGDAVTNLVYNQLLEDCLPKELKEQTLVHENDIIHSLLGTTLFEPTKRELAVSFFKLCVNHNIDHGWPTGKIVDAIEHELGSVVEQNPDYKNWLLASRKLLSNENRNIKFSDDGDILFRAITLVLLNPNPNNLKAIKGAVGPNVYGLAEKFALAREGYSFVIAEDRAKIGEERSTFLQKFNASFRNPVRVPICEQNVLAPETDVNDHSISLCQHKWLTLGEKNDFWQIFSINGIQPYAGYSLDLVYDETEQRLLLLIIDARGKYGMSKDKPKFSAEMINIQNELPDNAKFVRREYGLCLTLPECWHKTEDLKHTLEDIFAILRPLKLEKKKSAISNFL